MGEEKQTPADECFRRACFAVAVEKAQSRGLRFFCAFFRRAAMPPLPYQEGGFFMRCSIQNMTFTYDGSSEPVFPGWSAELDTGWRLG